MNKIKIEFFHDVICSFCFPMSFRVRKLQEIMPDVEIIHRSFALVKEENDFVRMFGSRERAKNEILTHWEHANQNDDLHRFNIQGMREKNFLFPMSMVGLWACKAAYFVNGNVGYWDLFDALQTSLFVQNKNIELIEVIFDNVKLVGLDFDKWQEFFNSETVKSEVEAEFELARKYGLHGVPALVINGDSIVSGAASLEKIFKAVENEHNKVNSLLSSDETCGLDGCKV